MSVLRYEAQHTRAYAVRSIAHCDVNVVAKSCLRHDHYVSPNISAAWAVLLASRNV